MPHNKQSRDPQTTAIFKNPIDRRIRTKNNGGKKRKVLTRTERERKWEAQKKEARRDPNVLRPFTHPSPSSCQTTPLILGISICGERRGGRKAISAPDWPPQRDAKRNAHALISRCRDEIDINQYIFMKKMICFVWERIVQ